MIRFMMENRRLLLYVTLKMIFQKTQPIKVLKTEFSALISFISLLVVLLFKALGRAVKDCWASGGDPIALLTIYKACWATGCSDADLQKAFDKDYLPSLITVGAAAVDRGFPPAITLGNIALWMVLQDWSSAAIRSALVTTECAASQLKTQIQQLKDAIEKLLI
ncbi:hypothetical protein Q3G72_030901 [Acer saccharum]|nr:hypothetical protein Q3G72_030901 [Acer saccharum]